MAIIHNEQECTVTQLVHIQRLKYAKWSNLSKTAEKLVT